MEEPFPTPPGIPEVMAVISGCQAALTGKLEAVQMEVSLIRQDLDKIRARLGLRSRGSCKVEEHPDPTNQGESP